MAINLGKFGKPDYEQMRRNPALNKKFDALYSKRPRKYRSDSAEAYYEVIKKQRKTYLVSAIVLIPVWILVVFVIYPGMLG
jgi:hypothetical protein